MGVRAQWRMQRHYVAQLQQVIQGNVGCGCFRAPVIGQCFASKTTESFYDGGADSPCSHYSDGQVPKLFPAYVAQPVIVKIAALDSGLACLIAMSINIRV